MRMMKAAMMRSMRWRRSLWPCSIPAGLGVPLRGGGGGRRAAGRTAALDTLIDAYGEDEGAETAYTLLDECINERDS